MVLIFDNQHEPAAARILVAGYLDMVAMGKLFLTYDELLELTGYSYAKYQREWLMNNGVPFTTNRMGEPKVKRCLYSHNDTSHQQGFEPDFGAI